MRRRLAQKFKSLFRLSRKPSPGGVVETSGIAPLTVPAPIVPASHNPPVQELDETRGVTLVGLRDLWQEAFNKLHPDTRSKLQSLAGDQLLATTNISHNITNLLDEIDNKRRKGEEETWKCVVEGQEIVLRDYAVKLVDGLKLAGDIAVEFVPGPAKLVWLVLKGFMTVGNCAAPVVVEGGGGMNDVLMFPGHCDQLHRTDGCTADVLGKTGAQRGNWPDLRE